ncbi:hypothetical protein M5K25_023850 [Dendrobium thyrsiflorum]|uniref:Uncharacterized protein n=1 Tax=Dendrobium thyrsiflorum TaxID=117978 RepID=A0ABD0U0I2_DENTH
MLRFDSDVGSTAGSKLGIDCRIVVRFDYATLRNRCWGSKLRAKAGRWCLKLRVKGGGPSLLLGRFLPSPPTAAATSSSGFSSQPPIQPSAARFLQPCYRSFLHSHQILKLITSQRRGIGYFNGASVFVQVLEGDIVYILSAVILVHDQNVLQLLRDQWSLNS